MSATATVSTEAGALVRRHVRVALDLCGVTWREYKGLLTSTFVATGTQEQFDRVDAMLAPLVRTYQEAIR